MPSFSQERLTAVLWGRFPGLDRLPPRPDAPRAALTFDDGPDEDATRAVLDALDEIGARATFFVVGEQLMAHHGLAREASVRGHELGIHGFAHVDLSSLSPQGARDDLARAIGTFEAGTGSRPRWFRPPYGRLSDAAYAACSDLGLEVVYWSAWGLDWETVAAERIVDIVGRDLHDGTIVLLHDSPRYAPRPSAAPTAEALTGIAGLAAERDLGFVTLSDAISGRMV